MPRSFGEQTRATYTYIGPKQEPNNANEHVIEIVGGQWGMAKLEKITQRNDGRYHSEGYDIEEDGVRIIIPGDWEAAEFAYFLSHLDEIKYLDLESDGENIWAVAPPRSIIQIIKSSIRGTFRRLFPPDITMAFFGMTRKCTGACGALSWKASTWSSS